MNLTVIAVGRMKNGPERSLWDIYVKRLKWSLSLFEVESKKSLGIAKIKKNEADLLLAKVPKAAVIVALDQNGLNVSSNDFAKEIGDWQDNGINNIAFIIGGPDGLDSVVRDKAQLSISLGHMTWPHMFARVMLIEQVYRAQCILSKHPYHK